MNTLQEGLVLSHLGKGIAVEAGEQLFLCQTRRKIETVAVGDRVLFSLASADQGRIEEILPRRSLLMRPSRNGKTRPVAANIDNVYVVFASEPAADFLLIDQYLAICENRNIDAVLVFNKIDLDRNENLERELQYYQALGYPLHRVSAADNIGIAELKQALNGHVSIFAGQSGVGKSSLTNTLIPDKELKTNTISATTRHGRHTTTAATLYHLPDGGDLIDSPGVAIFGLAGLTERQLAWGYREFQPLLDLCRFHNCRHVNDKGCAVKVAAENNEISMARYQRFLKLREKMPTD
ncbi:ribosome small subunit-dependent GTPase A [Methylomarinum sp. Ch1-1]|uniref:Small ribosomal subunit biogenesis GTPase RsgA n=1 Tax=Methylomarinum roseum TaxID=3067653 RepID=A0AAU7NQ36_9GAMM|nr:ribosome small subunit-dependent GTPase A [Methylomarinum sp. Ch1-1]MDP4521003.1 ribosome small subunit-dependent GTPase A [Methylomarinum sp. Ch1-1]